MSCPRVFLSAPRGRGTDWGPPYEYLWQPGPAEAAADVTPACLLERVCVSCNQSSQVHDLERMLSGGDVVFNEQVGKDTNSSWPDY